MTLAKFDAPFAFRGLTITDLRYFATWGIPVVTRLPLIRELLTSAASCVLTAEAV